jgi:hypothetical protein
MAAGLSVFFLRCKDTIKYLNKRIKLRKFSYSLNFSAVSASKGHKSNTIDEENITSDCRVDDGSHDICPAYDIGQGC